MHNATLDAIDTDLQVLDQKNMLLIEDFKQELRGVVRYLFKGQVVPSVIEQHCKKLFGELESVTTRKRVKISEDLIYGIKSRGTNERSINIFQAGQEVLPLSIRLTNDPARGDFPLREILYKNTAYREVPYNGNVYSHLHHQHPWFEQNYLSSLTTAGLITPTQQQLLSVFHRVHDVPEVANGDHFSLDKHAGNAADDSHAIGIMMDTSQVAYTPAERHTMQELFHRFEGNETIFKPGEMINYFRDAINAFDQRQFYAHDAYFALSIFHNYFPRFLDRSKTVTLLNDTPISQKQSTLPLQDIPLAKVFFQENAVKINQMIVYGIDHAEELLRIPNVQFANAAPLIALRKTREQLKEVYGITA